MPERITFIPPGTTISRSLSPILGSDTMQIDSRNFSTLDSMIDDMPTHIIKYRKYEGVMYQYDTTLQSPAKVQMSCANYGTEDAPLSFRSFITYSTTDKFKTEAFIDNRFYVARVMELPAEIFNSRQSSGNDHSAWATPHSFYLYRAAAAYAAPSPAP